MDDELPGGVWRIDAGMRADLRTRRVREALAARDWQSAIVEAEELLDEEPTHTSGLFLLGEALLETADFELARLAYGAHVRLDGGSAPSLLGLAIATFQTCDLHAAIENAREVVRLQPDNAEGHYYLGLALERMEGRASDAILSLTSAARLAPERFPLPLELDSDDWSQVLAAALLSLQPRLREFYDGVPFQLEDLPDVEELATHDPPLPPTIGALYAGDPPDLADPRTDPWATRPEAIRLFCRNLSRSPTAEELIDQLALALQEEALDWLGARLEDL